MGGEVSETDSGCNRFTVSYFSEFEAAWSRMARDQRYGSVLEIG
jgi:hypothetical protein